LKLLHDLALASVSVSGDIAEVGVYRGGSARILARLFPHKTVHLFDTFHGMPDIVHESDNCHKAGDFDDTSLEEVQTYLGDHSNVEFHVGIFPESAQSAEVREQMFALVHVDCDLYRSVRACCEFFYPRLSISGIMVFDDYHAETCLGARKAVDEFFADKPEKPVLPPIKNGGCYIIRRDVYCAQTSNTRGGYRRMCLNSGARGNA